MILAMELISNFQITIFYEGKIAELISLDIKSDFKTKVNIERTIYYLRQ